VWEALFGYAIDARRHATAALARSKARDVEYGAALALALSGDSTSAEKLAADLDKRFPEDTSVRLSYLPVLRALFALNQAQPSKAIDALQEAGRCELGTPGSSYNGNFGSLYPIYVRGLARLGARQPLEAAAEFQRILNHRGVLVSDPIGALTRLQLGRALAAAGENTKAKAAYQDFLTLWKNADSDVAILIEAKAEYGRL
jgi:hypothetical protein